MAKKITPHHSYYHTLLYVTVQTYITCIKKARSGKLYGDVHVTCLSPLGYKRIKLPTLREHRITESPGTFTKTAPSYAPLYKDPATNRRTRFGILRDAIESKAKKSLHDMLLRQRISSK